MKSSRNLLLISGLKQDQEMAAEIASQCGLSLLTAPKAQEGVRLLQEEKAALVFVDCSNEAQYHEVEQVLHERMGLFSEGINPNSFHFLVPNVLTLSKLKYTYESPLVGSLIFREMETIKTIVKRYSLLCSAFVAEGKMELSRFLKEGTEIQSLEIERIQQKADILHAVKNYFVEKGYSARAAVLATTTADELISNAFYEAPVDEFGKQIGKSVSQGTIDFVTLKSVKFEIGFDGMGIGMSVTDQYGSLNKSKLLAGVMSLFPDTSRKTRIIGSASQPIGLSSLVRQNVSLGFFCEASERTVATAFFPKLIPSEILKIQSRFLVTQFTMK